MIVGLCSWLPMHAVSQTLLDIALSEQPSPPALNVVHPRPVSWNSIISSVNKALVEEGVIATELPVVDFQTWFSQVEAQSRDPSEDVLKEIPAIKLLDFFRGIAQMDQVNHQQIIENVEIGGSTSFSTERVQSISGTIKALPPIDQSDAEMWVKSWKGVGFLDPAKARPRLHQ